LSAVSVPLRVGIFFVLAVAVVAPAAYGLATTQSGATAQTPARLEGGKKLYRQFCGQCHALKEARAVGIGLGSKNQKGETDMAGPSFNDLRVTEHQSLLAITGVWDGHSKVMMLMTRAEIKLVSKYIAAATRDHKYKATLPSDAFHMTEQR
jgi:mono/diheme cytochrome c family protein